MSCHLHTQAPPPRLNQTEYFQLARTCVTQTTSLSATCVKEKGSSHEKMALTALASGCSSTPQTWFNKPSHVLSAGF